LLDCSGHTGGVPNAELIELVQTSADPRGAALLLERLRSAPSGEQLLAQQGRPAEALVRVAAASPWLSRVCLTDPLAATVLAQLDKPLSFETLDGLELSRMRLLETLRIAARDLLGLDDLEQTCRALSKLASDLIQQALWRTPSAGLAVIGMGKLGAAELNYSSDVDLLLVAPDDQPLDVRPMLAEARRAWKVDLDLRPEGRSGPLARTLASYERYWDRWAQAWEFQALLKARCVAGEPSLGGRFEKAAATRVWSRPFGADELRVVRALKARTEALVHERPRPRAELKRGPGGIRDIEFAVQLLQMVHGRDDPALRVPDTLSGLGALAAGGYVSEADASQLASAYRFLRLVEHRLQLRHGQQTHRLPDDRHSFEVLARSCGFKDGAASAAESFSQALRSTASSVRAIHEKLFFRPLLEAFSSQGSIESTPGLEPQAARARLEAFGFSDADRTRQAVNELTRGLTRVSRFMHQALPLLFEWLSESPDPDLGLLGLRTLCSGTHRRDQLVALCRDSPSGARRLCLLLGTGPGFASRFSHRPELLGDLGRGSWPGAAERPRLSEDLSSSLAWRADPSSWSAGLRAWVEAEKLRISAGDIFNDFDLEEVGKSLARLAGAAVGEAFRRADPQVPLVVVAAGRLAGGELSYGSDLDLLFVHDVPEGLAPHQAAAAAETAANAICRLLGGNTPAGGVYRVDTALRPEGRQGPLSRSLASYEAYYRRWAQVWEKQAMLKARPLVGEPDLAARFEALRREFVWSSALGEEECLLIRRTKARMETERVPAGEDPEFHLKLGPGSLSDVEWTVQLLQLRHQVDAPGTLEALGTLASQGIVSEADAYTLEQSYRFCEKARNRLHLLSRSPTDHLPPPGPALSALARSLGMDPSSLRQRYRQVTRRARRVTERLFYR